MIDFTTIEAKASSLMIDDPQLSLLLYKRIYLEYREEYKVWNAINTMKLLRQLRVDEFDWASDLVLMFNEEKLINIYAWYGFDILVKAKSQEEIISQHAKIIRIVKVITQKDLSKESVYPCAKTLTILALADAYAKGNFQACKVLEVLKYLKPQYLSKKEQRFKHVQRGEIKASSDLEKYYSLKSKALEAIGQYSEVISLINEAFTQISEFHHDNKLWFTKRLAIAHAKTGNVLEGEKLLKVALKSPSGGSKWFIYKELAQLYYGLKKYPKAWEYSLEAAFHGQEPHFLISLFQLQARILFKLERAKDAALYARLIAAIIKEQDWAVKLEYQKIMEYYKVENSVLPSLKLLLIEYQDFINKERLAGLERQSGHIYRVHPNGKKGEIKSTLGLISSFSIKELKQRVPSLSTLFGAKVSYYAVAQEDASLRAEKIEILSKLSQGNAAAMQGKVLEGRVSGIKEFGIFVSLPGRRSGLVHLNRMPIDLKSTFQTKFKVGDTIKVCIDKETEKGLALKIVEVKG